MSVADATTAQFLDRASRKCTATVNVQGQSIWRREPHRRLCTGRHSLGQSKVWRLGDFPEILAQHRGLTTVVGRSALARRRLSASTGLRVAGVAAILCRTSVCVHPKNWRPGSGIKYSTLTVMEECIICSRAATLAREYGTRRASNYMDKQ